MDAGSSSYHRPVLVREVIEHLLTVPNGVYVDGTTGSGGHTLAILSTLGFQGRMICIDRDQGALETAETRLRPYSANIRFVHARFDRMDQVLRDLDVGKVHGILLDLGMSSLQLEQSGRGFSFNRDEPLDMRMNRDDETTAQQLVNTLSARELSDIFKKYGEERRAGILAKAIVRERSTRPLVTALQLAQLVRNAGPARPQAKHPATRVFQALRIAVNHELESLQAFLEKAPDLILPQGRLVILSYHSLEDRMVKQTIRMWEQQCVCPPGLPRCGCGRVPLFRRVVKKGIRPGQQEILENPKARSAVLRAAERI